MKKITVVTGVILAMLGIIVLPCSGQVINGCYQKNSGQLRIVDNSSECRSSELWISWNSMGPKGDKGDKGDPGSQGAQGPPGVGTALVYDANGQRLGYLIGFAGGITIYIPELRKLARIDLLTGEIVTCGLLGVYTDSDCSTVNTNLNDATSIYEICKFNENYYTGKAVAPTSTTFYILIQMPPAYSHCQAIYPALTVPIEEIQLPFTLPVALPLEFR